MPKKTSKKSKPHSHKTTHRKVKSESELRGGETMVKKDEEKRWQNKIMEPENYDWKKEQEKDWEERG